MCLAILQLVPRSSAGFLVRDRLLIKGSRALHDRAHGLLAKPVLEIEAESRFLLEKLEKSKVAMDAHVLDTGVHVAMCVNWEPSSQFHILPANRVKVYDFT